MNKFIFTFFLALICSVGFAQITNPDSLKQALKIATTDSARHNACVELYFYYVEVNRDSALLYAEKRLELAKQNNNKLAEAFALTSKSYQYTNMGKFAASYQNLLLALRIAEDPNSKEKNGWRLAQFPIPGKGRLILLSNVHQFLGTLMRSTENPKQEVLQFKEALRIARQVNHIDRQRSANMTLAGAYLRMNQLVMKPKPLESLNHFTIPVAIILLSY